MTLRTGQVFDRYRIESVLGEGGMGAVYRAYDTRLQRVVALKVLRPSNHGSTGGTGRVLREARAAAALQHENAVVIHDVGELDGFAFIAMEYVEGKPLRDYIDDPSVDLATRLRFLIDVARVLDAAHVRGLIHRDIKPENVMVRPDGTVKVLDFGIARRFKTEIDPAAPTVDSATPETRTGEGVVVGTPAYMAPEQVRSEPLDARADQFSWAVMAYEVLSGKLPWKPRAQVAIIASIVMDEPAPLVSVAPAVGERISNVIGRALSKSPDARYSSMEELIAALEAREAVPRRRRRPLWPVPLAIVAAGAIGTIVWALATKPPPPPPVIAAPSTSASAVARAITDHPDPSGCNAAAIKAYRDGLHALRQIGWDVAQHAFEAAIAADAGCAAPHLRLALMGPGLSMASARVRATYQTAARLRANLTPREVDLLDAAEPCIARDPPDRLECAKRARPLADKYPLDAEILVWVTNFADRSGGDNEALLRRAAEIDPLYADAWQSIAGERIRVRDVKGAGEALDKCIAVAPASNDCRFERVRMDFRQTECKLAEKHARDWIVRTPEQAFPKMFLANSLAAQGEPRDVVDEALKNRWPLLEADFRDFFAKLEEANAAVWFGDFAHAKGASDELSKMAIGSDYARHAEASLFAARLAAEEGRTQDAKTIAAAFRRGARVWPYPTVFTPYTWNAVPEAAPTLLRLERDAGGITNDDFTKLLGAWRDDALSTGRVSGMAAFAHGTAWLASTRAEAEKAIASSNVVPLRLDVDGALLRGNIGRLLQRAGRSDDALAYLRAAASDCGPLWNAFDAVHAHLWLAEHLEARGDRAGACAEYDVVSKRWGTTRSVTAAAARTRRTKLGC